MSEDKRYVYCYCNKCKQATPHKIIVPNDLYEGEVKARCEWCGNEIEVKWEIE